MDQSNTDISSDPVEVDREGRCQPPAAESHALFLEDRGSSRTRMTRKGIWASFVVYMLYGAIDILLVPDVAFYVILTRFVFSITTLTIFEVLVRTKAKR